MKKPANHFPRWLVVGLLALLGLTCAFLLWRLVTTRNLGGEDFVVYWAATTLVRTGQNPYDPALMRGVLETLIPVGADYTPMAWNPPFLFIFLLAFTWLPYATAKFAWLIVNLLIVLSACLMLRRLYLPAEKPAVVFLFILFAFSLPQVVVGIFMGQVTFLVFLGVVTCMFLIKKERWFWAGAALILTSIKPHMVVLVLIYLLLLMLRRRKLQGWAGLAFAGAVCIAGLFLMRPEWVSDLLGELKIAPVHWATPTIGGLLSFYRVTEAARSSILIFLPLPFLLAFREGKIKMEFSVALLTLITVPTTFFGWSFDQTILLIPAALVFHWIVYMENKALKTVLVIAISGASLVNWGLRLAQVNDVFYVWYPLAWWLIFGLAWCFGAAKDKPVTSLNPPFPSEGRT
jgi:hypothetical protein